MILYPTPTFELSFIYIIHAACIVHSNTWIDLSDQCSPTKPRLCCYRSCWLATPTVAPNHHQVATSLGELGPQLFTVALGSYPQVYPLGSYPQGLPLGSFPPLEIGPLVPLVSGRGRLLTIFSASHYAQRFHNSGAVALLHWSSELPQPQPKPSLALRPPGTAHLGGWRRLRLVKVGQGWSRLGLVKIFQRQNGM